MRLRFSSLLPSVLDIGIDDRCRDELSVIADRLGPDPGGPVPLQVADSLRRRGKTPTGTTTKAA